MRHLILLAELLAAVPAFAGPPRQAPRPPQAPPAVACSFCSPCSCPAGSCPAKCPVQAPAQPAAVTHQLAYAYDARGRLVAYYQPTTTSPAVATPVARYTTGGCPGGNCPLPRR